MRAMAILYIGPHRNPDFATDYHLSPILTPSHLLAQFPPLLLQCGEKDPFVDDTVIFAGRIREAKRARKAELEISIAGKSARFGEGLRMSGINSALDDKSLADMRKERDKLAKETEEDWVQMVLFEDWSHGYLQMPGLMLEAKAVIEELAEWIDAAFCRNVKQAAHEGASCLKIKRTTKTHSPSSETETDDTGITFVPKKYQNGTSPTRRISGPGSNLDGSDSEGANDRILIASQKLARDVVGNEGRRGDETPKGSGSRQAGTPITETELMRKRRLLDYHIFEKEGS